MQIYNHRNNLTLGQVVFLEDPDDEGTYLECTIDSIDKNKQRVTGIHHDGGDSFQVTADFDDVYTQMPRPNEPAEIIEFPLPGL